MSGTTIENAAEHERIPSDGVDLAELDSADKAEKPAQSKRSEALQKLLEECHAASLSKSKRVLEIFGIIVWNILLAILGIQLVMYREYTTVFRTTVAAFIGIMSADFLTGAIHWFFDTWGDTDTPVIGKTAVLLFREHHVAPQAFTHRDWVVTWGEPCLIGAFFALGLVLSTAPAPETAFRLAYNFYIWSFFTTLILTGNNQIHKWAHMTHYPVPAVVKWMQKWHILVSHEHHHVHHMPPHIVRYCLITGLPNYPLDYFKFWRGLEWIIERLTGLKARARDFKLD